MNYKLVEDNGMFFILDKNTDPYKVILVIDTKEKTIADLTGDDIITADYGKDRH